MEIKKREIIANIIIDTIFLILFPKTSFKFKNLYSTAASPFLYKLYFAALIPSSFIFSNSLFILFQN